MAGAVALVWDLIARDQASPAFARVAKSADAAAVSTGRATGSALSFGKKAGAALAAFASVDFAVHAVKAAAEFQRSMLQIQTLAGASAAEVRDMSQAVLGLAGATGQAPEQLATSLYHVESIGLRGKKAMDVVKIAAEGAKVGMADLEETTNALTSTVASGIPGVKNMGQAMGALIAIVGEGDMKFSDLNEALGSGILSVVKGYGLSLRDVGAALATFGDNNIRGADAATALRMAVQALAVPAKAGKGAIESIGLSMNTLQKDMQHGGLNAALLDLNKHIHQAGISSVELGGFLTEAFGKRAGIGLSVLMGQMDRFEQKFQGSARAATGFASKWDETQHTAGVAFDKLRSKLQVFEIEVGNKLIPVVTAAANWLGTYIPRAFSTLRDLLTPTAHLVGDVLGGAWRALSATLSTVGGALQGIGHFLSAHKTIVTTTATAVLGMWAAYKGYRIVAAAVTAIRTEMGLLSTRVGLARVQMTSFGTAANLALGLVGVAVIAATAVWAKHQSAVAKQKQTIDELTDAYKQDSGAIGENTRQLVAHQLGQDGVLNAASKVGLSLKTVTDAALGNKDAIATVNEGYKAFMGTQSDLKNIQSSNRSDDTASIKRWNQIKDAVGGTDGALKTAIQNYRNEAAAQGKSNEETKKANVQVPKLTQFQKDLASAQKDVKSVLGGTTVAFEGQQTVVDRLSGALDKLSGRTVSAIQAELNLKDALASGPGEQGTAPTAGALSSAQGSAAAATNRHARAVEALAIAQRAYNAAQHSGDADKIAAAQLRLHRAQDAVASSTNAVTTANQRLAATQGKVASANKSASATLNTNTAAGRKNVEWLLNAVSLANAHAEAVAKQTGNLDKSIGVLKTDEAAIRSAAAEQGIFGKGLDDLLAKTEASPGELMKVLGSQIDTAGTKALALQKKLADLTRERTAIIKIGDQTGEANKHIQDQLDALTHPRVIPISIKFGAADLKNRLAGAIVNGVGLNARGTDNWRGGLTWVGEEGPELLNLPRGTRITDNKQSMAAVAAGGAQTHVTVNQTIVNPVAEPPSVSGPTGLRRAALALGK